MPEAAAPLVHPADRVYRGPVTDPERWSLFRPQRGDVILATPAKCGTTWNQSMIAMLLRGTTELPDALGRVSLWIDGIFTPADETVALLAAQTGRRVVKTHTPVDGWPVWEGVHVVAVFRHPLEVLLSIRKHMANRSERKEHPYLGDLDNALNYYLETPFDDEEIDRDTLAVLVWHFEAAISGRCPDILMLNYAAISRDHAGALRQLDDFLGTGASPELLDAIRSATEFGAMKARANDFAPEVANKIWRDPKEFFASGQSGGWQTEFSPEQIARYEARFAELLPNADHRRWIETGHGDV